MSKKKPAKPAKRSKGELSSDDLDSVAGGTLSATPPPPLAGGASDVPTDSVSLNYAKIEWTYKQTDQSTGQASGPTPGAWPLKKK